jgi:hypothetical protein
MPIALRDSSDRWGLVAAHVVVALYHPYRRHDGVMTRMLPRGRGAARESASA